jgi:phenylalanyl-tRNA synthetase beta chain
MRAIPRCPGATRDVWLLMAVAIPASAVARIVAAAAEPLVSGVHLLEDSRDAKLGDGNESMLWSIDSRSPERTLTDAEIDAEIDAETDAAHAALVGALLRELPAQRR